MARPAGRDAAGFVLGWHGWLGLVFTAGNIARTRYRLPAHILDAPLVTALLLGWMHRDPAVAACGFGVAAVAAMAVFLSGIRHLPPALRDAFPAATASIHAWANAVGLAGHDAAVVDERGLDALVPEGARWELAGEEFADCPWRISSVSR